MIVVAAIQDTLRLRDERKHEPLAVPMHGLRPHHPVRLEASARESVSAAAPGSVHRQRQEGPQVITDTPDGLRGGRDACLLSNGPTDPA
ncbi:MAG: hypothetical protein ACREA0_01975 [bacterium]